jgi:hypothetical protein
MQQEKRQLQQIPYRIPKIAGASNRAGAIPKCLLGGLRHGDIEVEDSALSKHDSCSGASNQPKATRARSRQPPSPQWLQRASSRDDRVRCCRKCQDACRRPHAASFPASSDVTRPRPQHDSNLFGRATSYASANSKIVRSGRPRFLRDRVCEIALERIGGFGRPILADYRTASPRRYSAEISSSLLLSSGVSL